MTLVPHMVTIDCADPRALATSWTEAAGHRVDRDFGGEFLVLVPEGEDALAIGPQHGDEPRTGKHRAHIDRSATDRAAEVARLVDPGATVLDEQRVPGLTWTVLADAEGNECCVSG